MNNINLHTWFVKRELDFCPLHFVPAKTPISDESLYWILEKLQGRFYLGKVDFRFLSEGRHPFFEDPQEAVLYELTWS
jgi:hypothetical protein